MARPFIVQAATSPAMAVLLSRNGRE